MASDIRTDTKTEPTLDVGPVSSAIVTPSPVRLTEGGSLDQLSRLEDKTARIEEKFARSEERMMRLESALEKATIRLEGATQEMNLQGLKEDVARMRADIRRKPGWFGIFLIALVAVLLGLAAGIAIDQFGIPGLLPR